MRFIFFLLMFLSVSALAQNKKKQWKLIWQDEFSTNGIPDTTKWGFAGRGKSDWNCYCADNTSTAIVKDGSLFLNGILNNDSSDTARYQTGCIQTKNKFSFKFGKLEVRAKLGKGQGSWPAIWMMPESSEYGGWPKSGEIDVMEQLNSDTVFYQTMHSYFIDVLKHKNEPKYFTTSRFKVNEFNVFGMEWYPDRIDLLINGVKTFSYPKLKSDSTGTQWPFDHPFYIIMDQALGGSWPGPVKSGDLPVSMMVDWVRVYQKQ
jgi:beta-glucanase (GH16 family)